jgi:hypothetical protein
VVDLHIQSSDVVPLRTIAARLTVAVASLLGPLNLGVGLLGGLMDIQRVKAALDSPTGEAIGELLGDESTAFWVDWGQEDETIADACEDVLLTGCLSGELVEVDTNEGVEVYIQYGDRRVHVPLTYRVADRHITLCVLNDVLAPDYEVRFCIDSKGGDTLAFLQLTVGQWAELERQYGGKVGERFYRIEARPSLFTDPLRF